MRHPVSFCSLALGLFSLACEGRLIEPRFPGQGNPPGTPPVLALRLGAEGADQISAVVVDPAGNAYVTGTFSASVDFDPGTALNVLTSLGGTDVFLAKYSPNGALIWVDRVGGTGAEIVNSLVRDGAGNLYLAGGFEGNVDFDPGPGLQVLNSSGATDGYVAKFTGDGTIQWARRFGGPAADEVRDLGVDGAGNVYAAGVFLTQADAAPLVGSVILSDGAAADGFLVSFDGSGGLRWAMPMGGSEDDAVTAVGVSSGGTVTVAGVFRGTADFARNAVSVQLTSFGGADVFLASYTSAGALNWAHNIGGPNDEAVAPGGVALDAAGGAALLGTFSGSVDFDPSAAIAARTSVGTRDLFLARYGSSGAFASVFSLGGLSGTASAARVIIGPGDAPLITGSFSGSLDFEPGTGTEALTSLGTGGATDAFVAEYSSLGGLVWVRRFGELTSAPGNLNAGTSVTVDAAGNVLAAGRFFGSPDFDPGSGSFRMASLGDADGFLVKLTSTGTLAR
jgi:hypothetical protein